MSTTKPTTLPTWATDGGSIIRSPNAGKKAMGFTAEERPPAEYLNWLAYWLSEWTEYLHKGPVVIPATAMTPRGDHLDQQGFIWGSDNAVDTYIDIPLIFPVGRIITAIDLIVLEANLAGEEIEADLYGAAPPGAASLETITSGVTGAQATLSFTATSLPLTITAGYQYFIEVNLQTTSGAAESGIYQAEITFG